MRIFFTVLCALLCLTCLGFAIFGLTIVGHALFNGLFLFAICMGIAAAFGYFVYHDVVYYLSLKSTTPAPVAKPATPTATTKK